MSQADLAETSASSFKFPDVDDLSPPSIVAEGPSFAFGSEYGLAAAALEAGLKQIQGSNATEPSTAAGR